MRTQWLTDIHLNFLDHYKLNAFLKSLKAKAPDALFISGDIGEANSVARYLRKMESELSVPIYFVLGNHDFYQGAVGSVRSEIDALTQHSQNLVWLTKSGYIELKPGVGLLGQDSWADGRFGDYANTGVELNDFRLIKDLRYSQKADRLRIMQMYADDAAEITSYQLSRIDRSLRKLIYLTHVPPFRESCWHVGAISGEDWLPYFSCKVVGDALRRFAESHPKTQVTVLCGHTHSSGIAQILPNLTVYTGGAEYGKPMIQMTIEIE